MPKPAKPYPIRLVGTRNYLAAIAAIGEGDVVQVRRENGNPHDPDALVVLDNDGARLGYIQRDSWLKRALIDEEKGCHAKVEAIEAGAGVTIAVLLTGNGPIGDWEWAAEN